MSGEFIKKLNKDTTYNSFEHAVWSSRIRNKDCTLIGIYHPPQGMQQGIRNTDFITDFTEFLTEATSKHSNIFILGNFNIYINYLEDVDSCLILDTIRAFNLKQQVDIPTHNLGHTLDLIIMENSEEWQVGKVIPGPYILDHGFITMQLTEHKLKVQQLLTKHRKIPDNIAQEFISTSTTNKYSKQPTYMKQ